LRNYTIYYTLWILALRKYIKLTNADHRARQQKYSKKNYKCKGRVIEVAKKTFIVLTAKAMREKR